MHESILKGKKILIVEDDLSSRLYLNKILEKTDAILFNAGDGREALEYVENDPEIDIVLMDIQLPVMDGYTSARKIRELRPEVKLIAQTAYSFAGDKDDMNASGFDDFLIKPIYSAQLIEKLAACFKQDPEV
ncbi:MAG TPA: response regulator [Bacteroidales bacterium]|jgi:CheY-like chemotaxis protein|nr:response regulator [Bacteroidales bacterium]HOS71951.1 response regulator [Bacteroidales bacterium]HQH23397.1 response regulator [Bacteroidales bacterium]HQJ81358.1 response regulator [Bacteroidales bacterium]